MKAETVDAQVVTRLKRPALCVQWSPCGQKFAIGSAGKEVSVCYSNAQDGWWAAAVIRRAGSAVMGVAWHPSGELLATASTDGKCRVFYAQPAGNFLNPLGICQDQAAHSTPKNIHRPPAKKQASWQVMSKPLVWLCMFSTACSPLCRAGRFLQGTPRSQLRSSSDGGGHECMVSVCDMVTLRYRNCHLTVADAYGRML